MFFILNSNNIKKTWIFSFEIIGNHFLTVISKFLEIYLFIYG